MFSCDIVKSMNNQSSKVANKLHVNMVSESEFTVQGHGVHTAYKEISSALAARDDVELAINSTEPADIIHIQTVGFYSFKKLVSRHGKKVVSAHLVPDSFIGSIAGAKYWRPLARWWLKYFYSKADLVLACSGMVKRELETDMKLRNVALLYNTVNMSRYKITSQDRQQSREKLGIKPEDFLVLGNGQVQPRKRLNTFLAIAKQMPDVKFIWVGGIPFKQLGADYHGMQKIINNLPENVKVTGLIPLEEVRQYYAAADVFVLPAEQENHPMCVLEAAGAGLPIVLRDIPQYNDTFSDSAIMASTDEQFINAVHQLRTNSEVYDNAKKASQVIANRFDSSAGAERAVGFYRTLL